MQMRTGYGKWAVLLAALLIFSLALAGCGKPAAEKGAGQSGQSGQGSQGGGQEPIKIGVVLDITGPASSLGVPERDSIKLVEEELAAKGGINGRPVQIIVLDNESDETKSLLAAKKLLEQEKVVALVGTSASGTSMAIKEAAQKAEVPMVSAAASIKIVAPVEQSKWVFKTAHSDVVVAQRMIDYLKAKNIKKVAFMSMNNTFGDSGLKEFSKVAEQEGITIVAKEKFDAGDKDMTAQLTRVKGTDAQGVVVWAIPPSASIVTANYRQLGIKLPLIHSHGIGNKKFIELAGGAANGVVFPIGKLVVAEDLPDSDPQKAVLVKYAKDFEAKYGSRSTFGGHAWDAIQIVVKAIEKAGDDKAKIREEIEKTQGFAGISGTFDMSATDHNGLTKEDLIMVEIVDGKWKLVK